MVCACRERGRDGEGRRERGLRLCRSSMEAARPRSTDRALSTLQQQHWSSTSLPDVDRSSGPVPAARRRGIARHRRPPSYSGGAGNLSAPDAADFAAVQESFAQSRRASGDIGAASRLRVSGDLNRHSQRLTSMAADAYRAPIGRSSRRAGGHRGALLADGWPGMPGAETFPLSRSTRQGRPSLSQVRGFFLVFVQLFEKYETLIERYKALIEKVSALKELSAGRMPLLSDIAWAGGELPPRPSNTTRPLAHTFI
eukprot:SAG31_NODE_472_length_15237_cov_3.424891_11_plen_255_part_00